MNFVETFPTKQLDERDIAVFVDYNKITDAEIDISNSTKYVVGADFYFNPSQFDANAPGYEAVFLKFAMHEIGHTFGLDHPPDPQTVGKSTLNG